MDLKALIAKMDHIESKKILTESSEPTNTATETVVIAEQEEGIVFTSGIAQALLKEFNLDEADPAAQNPWPADSEKAKAWAALSPEDQKWLGKADPTDKMILARAPNKGKAATPAAAPAAAGGAGAGAAAPATPGASVQTDDEGNTLVTTASGQVTSIGPDGKPYEPGSNPNLPKNQAAAAAAKPAATADAGTIDPNKLKRFKELLAKAGQGAPAAAPATAGAAAGGAAPAAKV